MVPTRLATWARRMMERAVAPLARAGISPNAVTVAGFLFNVLTAAVLATGRLQLGGALLLLTSLSDMMDGALARVSQAHSDFGAFLDSLLDRYSEAAVLLALIFVFSVHHQTPLVVLTYAVAVGSLLISYARARAEGLGMRASVGIAPRPERIIILGAGLLIGGDGLIAALVLLAVLTHVTALQRLYHVWRSTADRDVPPRHASTRVGETRR